MMVKSKKLLDHLKIMNLFKKELERQAMLSKQTEQQNKHKHQPKKENRTFL